MPHRRITCAALLLLAAACSGRGGVTADSGARGKTDAAPRIDAGLILDDAAAIADAAPAPDAAEAVPDAAAPDAANGDAGAEDAMAAPDATAADGSLPDAQPADAGLDCTFGAAAGGPLDPRSALSAARLADLRACAAADPARASAMVDGLLAEHLAAGGGAPWDSGESLVVFRGDGANLSVSGSFDNWPNPGTRVFQNIPNTDLHVARIPVGASARHQYKLTRARPGQPVDWFTDPINRWVTWDGINRGGVGEFNNELVGPSHVPTTSLMARLFVRDRDVFLQLPVAHFTTAAAMGVLYVHDGNEMLTRSGMQAVVDGAIAGGNAAPIAVAWVALPNQNVRFDEYTYVVPGDPSTASARGAMYIDYLVTEVAPAVEAHLRLAAMPEERGLAGASLGGLISAYGAWLRPDFFRKVGAQSPSLFWGNEDLRAQVASGPVQPIRFYLDSGSPNDNAQVTDNFAATLAARGYDHVRITDPGAPHDWAPWARRFPGLLEFLY